MRICASSTAPSRVPVAKAHQPPSLHSGIPATGDCKNVDLSVPVHAHNCRFPVKNFVRAACACARGSRPEGVGGGARDLLLLCDCSLPRIHGRFDLCKSSCSRRDPGMRVACPAKQIFQKVTHVIFDLDGLLLDTEILYTKAAQNVVSKYGKSYTQEIKHKTLGFQGADAAKEVVKLLDLPLTWQEYYKLVKQQYPVVMRNANFMPGAERLVRHFHTKQIPIAVATSSGQDTYDIKVEHHKSLFSLFSHVVTGGTDPEVKSGKPSPDIFLVCARRFKDSPKPEQCLVLEDAPNGVQAAVKAGMQVVMVPDKQIEEKATKLATLKLNSLEEFRPEMFGLPPLE
ncbi:probable pseudouridine-5'-phosphatase isoform X2 [Zophobas morio]|uniref:probable pseudouridine-5'-phosphatase isoform X2 n=1 Tax=Zophobas morio TaxID=2755281 RepID=UPI003082E3E6